MNLSDALSHYVAASMAKLDTYAHQELHRFARWMGRERVVDQVVPHDVARYAEEVAAAGGDIHGRLVPIKDFLTYLRQRGFSAHSLASHVKIPRSSRPPSAIAKGGPDVIHMTPEGHGSLERELTQLKGQRKQVAEVIRTAAADKDFRENSPLEAAREDQGKMEARIREIEGILHRAVIMGPTERGKGVQVGSEVVLQDVNTGQQFRYRLVDSSETDPASGKISVSSPVGKAAVGCTEGDEIDVTAPRGVLRYRVVGVNS